MSGNRFEPLFDVHPATGVSIEVFYADSRLVTFGRGGAGWFWWPRRRGLAPEGPARGPFPTRYAAFRNALGAPNNSIVFGRKITTNGGAGFIGCPQPYETEPKNRSRPVLLGQALGHEPSC
jgi:hypothetical protein